MVTLDTDAAWDYQSICALLSKGMTCARINCAHDSPDVWQAMIRNIRRAEVEKGRACKIMMDLAGHKIRTGLIETGLAVHHIKTTKDINGHALGPAYIVLCTTESLLVTEHSAYQDLYRFAIASELLLELKPGAYLGFKDARGKQRFFQVEKPISDLEVLVSCQQSSYFKSVSELALFQGLPESEQTPLVSYATVEFLGDPLNIKVFLNEFLLPTEY